MKIFKKAIKRNKIIFSEHSYYPDMISKTPILLDLGACYGAFSKHFLEVFPSAKIIMVEANPTNFSKIDINSDHCTVLNRALSLKEDKITFYEDENSSQNGSILFNYFEGIKHDVETITLEMLVENFQHIDLVKMDVEGAEWEILLNTPAESILKIDQISVEFHDFIQKDKKSSTVECVRRLKKLGYKLDYESTDYKEGCKYYDCLFYKIKNK